MQAVAAATQRDPEIGFCLKDFFNGNYSKKVKLALNVYYPYYDARLTNL